MARIYFVSLLRLRLILTHTQTKTKNKKTIGTMRFEMWNLKFGISNLVFGI